MISIIIQNKFIWILLISIFLLICGTFQAESPNLSPKLEPNGKNVAQYEKKSLCYIF